MWLELIKEFFHDLKMHRVRAILTLIAITWGTLSVILLLAFGEGLGNRILLGEMNAGNRIMIVYGGETTKLFEGLQKGRRVRMTEEDVDLVKRTVNGIDMISPQYRNQITLTYKKNSATTECEGVNPGFEEMRRMYPAGGGRFLDDADIIEQRRVIFLGVEIAKDLFGDEDPIGKTVMVDGLPFTLVGIMQKKMQTSMNNGPDTRRAIIPYTSFRTMYGDRYVNSIVIHPTDPSKQASIKSDLYRVLGRKYRFDPDDERTLGIWDFIEDEKINRKITLGISIFLGSVGLLTLIIAGVGVANVMYVVVKERTREIGIRMAIGARRSYILAQFIFEALFLAFIGGAVGMSISYGIISLVRMFPADDGPMQFLGRPVLSPAIMLLTTAILGAIGFLAGFFPARRAASVDPVESLRYE
ncbi:MAG TPA: ABC transporter permease [Bacteroidota bacterium]|jgi:putative ABC transport system permease protein|nr:ABC transporter permease [Bacteroidota bacterium]